MAEGVVLTGEGAGFFPAGLAFAVPADFDAVLDLEAATDIFDFPALEIPDPESLLRRRGDFAGFFLADVSSFGVARAIASGPRSGVTAGLAEPAAVDEPLAAADFVAGIAAAGAAAGLIDGDGSAFRVWR